MQSGNRHLDAFAIARLEEGRAALGTAELIRACRDHEPGCDDWTADPIAGGWMTCAVPGAWANQAVGLGLAGPVGDDDLDRLVAFYVSRGVEPRIEVAATADASLLAGLAARGFVLREMENVLARGIDPDEDLDAILPHPRAAGLTIERVDPDDATAADELSAVAASGFVDANEPMPNFIAVLGRQMLRHPGADGYLARIDGVVAGGAAMGSRDGLTGLFGTSVRPEFRRRGLQAALIAARLARARDRGSRLAVIHSGPGIPTERNAARLGFALVYAKAIMAMPGAGLVASM